MKPTTKEEINALSKIIDANPINMRLMMEQFDLIYPKIHNILIDDYELDNGRIVINSAKVLSDSMEFVRFADMSKLIDRLDECNIIFHVRKQGTT